MAEIWRVYDGKTPTIGCPSIRLPLSDAIAVFELRPSDFVSDLNVTPRFGAEESDLTYAGFKHIVVEIEPNEGQEAEWKPGFYRSRLRPQEAFQRLIRQPFAAEFGERNVLRVDCESTVDSQGREALKITVVIAPGATRKLREGAALDARIRLQQRLREMRDNRIPIIGYATEAELQQDARSQS